MFLVASECVKAVRCVKNRFLMKRVEMDSKAGKGQKDSHLSPKERKDVKCELCGCTSASDYGLNMENLIKKFEEVHRLKKHLDFFGDMLTALKKLNGDMQMSESEVSDPLSIVDYLKGLLSCMDKGETTGLPTAYGSALYMKLCELTEKFSHLDNMVNRVESVFSRKTVRNLTNLLDECQKNMLGFQVGLKEFQYIGVMERVMIELNTINKKLFQFNSDLVVQNDKLFDQMENTFFTRRNILERGGIVGRRKNKRNKIMMKGK